MDGVDAQLSLTLDTKFITENSESGNLCSLRVSNEYGDMRSLFKSDTESEQVPSYGQIFQLTPDFSCLGSEDFDIENHVYDLRQSTFIDDDFIKQMQGKGILLQNLRSDTIIGFGVINQPDALPQLGEPEQNVVAICHDKDRLNVILYSDLDLNAQKVYGYYQPLTRNLLDSVSETLLQIKFDGYPTYEVSQLTTTTSLCSSFDLVFDDTISSFTYYVAGKQVEVWLKVTQTSEIVHLYDTDPLQCTFGLANPAYTLSFESYCSELAPMEILREMLIDSGANTDPEVDPEPVKDPDSVVDQEPIDQEPNNQEPIDEDPIDQEPND